MNWTALAIKSFAEISCIIHSSTTFEYLNDILISWKRSPPQAAFLPCDGPFGALPAN